MAFKYQFETILNLKTRMEDMKNAELKLAIEKSRNYTEELLLKYIEELADLDYEIKSGLKDADSGLELFLIGI